MSEDAFVLPVRAPSSRLLLADVPVGEPLAWPIVTADGVLLCEAGSTLASLAARAFLFEQFEPHRLDDDHDATTATQASEANEAPMPAAGALTLDDLGLKIGARVGLRGPAGSAAYSSRVIGFSTAGANRASALFITQPVLSGHQPLALTRGERVELVALTSRSVFQFACTVDSVCREPFHYLVLSEPGTIRRLRARKFVRMATRLPVRFADAGKEDIPLQIGLIRDISPFGMSLAVAEAGMKLGDRLRLSFRFNTDGTDVEINCHATVRHVQDADLSGANGVYGMEFESLEPSQRIALKSFMAEQG
jgi:c-di-GMP-binding flagellar brake protein YcgR